MQQLEFRLAPMPTPCAFRTVHLRLAHGVNLFFTGIAHAQATLNGFPLTFCKLPNLEGKSERGLQVGPSEWEIDRLS